ncbi:PLDc N-terminal domain-containing protein [Winogradskyella vincentii]|uniref:PLDc N-terminal domain-containing protein n=1 Tax=Winogradskyella vincentii TaxID=2877122 RepID=A0ABS7XVU6_9FLAO|nr:PLDc N-terminal domain-containing protein [Winogradskyella vincentii]
MTVVDSGLVNFFIGCYILIILFLCIVVLRSKLNLNDKLIWLVLLLFLPVLGVFFYIMSITFKVRV